MANAGGNDQNLNPPLDSPPQASEPLRACTSNDLCGQLAPASFLLQIARTVSKPEETLGVLIHGSFATGGQARGSDIDLVCVTKTGNCERRVQQVDGFEVDSVSGSRSSVEKAIRSQLCTNNNSILYAFTNGRPLMDSDGSLAGLVYEARQIWTKGPTPPTNDELERIKAAARSASAEAARLAIRAARSSEWHEIASLRSSILFVDSVHNFCRTHELWASAIWELLKWSDTRYGFLQTVIWSYISAPSLANRLKAIQDLGQATISRTPA
jgi:hypothetical protein